MHDDSGFVLPRVARFVRERLTPALHREKVAAGVAAWTAPGEPVPFAEAVAQEYRPIAVGEAWGRPWGTAWLHVTGTVPASWTHPELVVDLGFTGAGPGFQAEGTVYAPDGVILGGVEPRRRAVPLVPGVQQGDIAAPESEECHIAATPLDLYVEAAANPDMTGGWGWAPTPLGDLATAGDDPLYRLGAVDLADLDVDVWALGQDIWTLTGLVEALPGDLPRRAEVLRALDRAVDAVDPGDVAGTAAAARAELEGVLSRPAYASAHRVYAVGHAHIDSAWLWPVRETVRKVTRTFANALQLMDRDEDFVF
ncbi:MAG: alpha-mannosidase, partial [Pseudonocardia sp.]|nr:alpha-mannosidase [Pseudonocardia sp.]